MSLRGSALILATVPLLAPVSAGAQEPVRDSVVLTRQQARARAQESGPRFLAARAMGDAARGAATTDRVYPFNPRAEIKGAETLDPGGYGDYEAVFSQEFEWAGQFLLRRAAGASAIEAAEHTERDALRALVLELDAAFFGVTAARERSQVAEEGAALARTLRDAVRIQFEAGRVSALELNVANIEGGRAEARALAARNELTRMEQTLRDLLGLGAEVSVRTVADDDTPAIDVSNPEALVAAALAHRPDVLAARASERAAEKERALATRTLIPNLDVGAVLDRNTADADATWGLRVALAVPLWNRNQGRRQETRALEQLRTIERQDLELRVRGEVRTALQAYRTATEELDLLAANVLQPTRENRTLLRRAFEAGQIDLPTALLLQTQQISAEMSYWETWLRQRIALAELEAALGETSG